MRPTRTRQTHNRGMQPSRRAVLSGLATGGLGVAFGATTAATREDDADEGDETDAADGVNGYDLEDAQRDGYWYFRHNVESVLLGGAGVQFPDRKYADDPDHESFAEAVDDLDAEPDDEEFPVEGLTSLTIAPYETSNPQYVTRPTFSPRPVQATLRWDGDGATTREITPAGAAWFVHAAFELARAFDDLGDPSTEVDGVAEEYSALFELAGWRGLEYAFGDGGVLRDEADEDDEGVLALARSYDPEADETTFEDERAIDYAATVWCLSTVADRADVHPAVETAGIDVEDATDLADSTARAIVDAYDAETIADEGGIANVGLVLSALGRYGSVGTDDALPDVERFGTDLVASVDDAIDDDGRIATGDEEHQAAVQGAVGQGLDLANDGLGLGLDDDGVDDVLSSLVDDSWSDEDGTFDDERANETIATTVWEAGDIVGGLNAALSRLEGDEVRDVTAAFMDRTVHNSALQRAQLDAAVAPDAAYWLPSPANAGGWFGQAPVFNGGVEYRRDAELWQVVDRAFHASEALYAACQFGWLAANSEGVTAQ